MGQVKVKPDDPYICRYSQIFIDLDTDKYNLNIVEKRHFRSGVVACLILFGGRQMLSGVAKAQQLIVS
jgi:hypothetical protein